MNTQGIVRRCFPLIACALALIVLTAGCPFNPFGLVPVPPPFNIVGTSGNQMYIAARIAPGEGTPFGAIPPATARFLIGEAND